VTSLTTGNQHVQAMTTARQPQTRFSAPVVAILTATVLLALFVTDLLTVGGIIGSRDWITRAQQTQALIGSVRAELLDAETAERDFLLTGRSEYRVAYETAMRALPAKLADLRPLTADDPVQLQNVRELDSLVDQKMVELGTTLQLYEQAQISQALEVVRSDQAAALVHRVRQLIAEMGAREDSRLAGRTLKARRNLDTALWIDVAALAGLMLLGWMLFAITRDIGRRQALENALRDQAALQERFIAILGHDLRNPLNAVLMAARRMKQANVSERWNRSVDFVISGARRMTRLVDQLLDLARTRQTGGIPIKVAPGTDLREVVRAAVEELCAAHPRAAIVLKSDEPISGSWDPDRLAQVASNLIGNAISHGAGRVDVSVRRSGDEAILEVQNGGTPIQADILPRIFEAFERPAGDISAHGDGLGLGLYIAERIVAAHGGKIAVRSSAEEGTIFAVTMPASASASASASRPGRRSAVEPAAEAPHLAIG
jgi:signal transduction histidine kinase